MRGQAGRIAVALVLAAGCATTQPPPVRLVVHVDTLAPEKLQQYESARLAFAGLLRARGLSDRRGLFLKIGSHTYYSVVTFGRWRDLEALRAARVKAQAKLGKAADEYGRLSDESLVFPHTTEIWNEEPALAYVPTGMRLPQAVQVVIEDVKPTADYEAAWKPIAAALARAQYPVERRTYFSSYGTGRMVSFWMATSPAVAKAAPTLLQALTGVVGAERAQALVQAWRDCVAASQEFDVEPQPEMSAY